MCNCHNCFLTVSVPTATNQNKFEDSQRLRRGISSVSVRMANGTTKKNPQGATLAADAVLFSSHLVWVNGSGQKIAEIPIENLVRTKDSPEPLCVNWAEFDPTQSYVLVDTTAAGYNAAHVIEFTIAVECENKC